MDKIQSKLYMQPQIRTLRLPIDPPLTSTLENHPVFEATAFDPAFGSGERPASTSGLNRRALQITLAAVNLIVLIFLDFSEVI